jgi:hypothetical protein
MPRFLVVISILGFFLLSSNGVAQDTINGDLVQFSGVMVTADSLTPVPLAHILVKQSYRGTISDYNGYFSFVARQNDTIIFSAIGFKNQQFIIPDTISNNRYSMIQVMATDTIYLSETVIYPWPTREQFKEAFLKIDIPDDDITIARKNLNQVDLMRRSLVIQSDGSLNYDYMVTQRTDQLYYNGQTQPITILNPFAWAEFIKAWKEGKFKRKEYQ